ncbi:MAG: hypothetical protein ACRDTG_16220 [Pseudonocardiaceae bacterium]
MSDPDLYPWLALRRVNNGGMAKSAGAYFDHGRPTPAHLAEVFDQLLWTGFVTVAEGDTLWALRRMSLTDTGKARYVVLAEQLDPAHAAPPPAAAMVAARTTMPLAEVRIIRVTT